VFEVLGDPAEPEREAGTEDQRSVDIGGRRHNAFFEQVMDLVCDRL